MAEGRHAEAAQDGRIEKINGPFLFRENGHGPNTCRPRLWLAVEARVRHLCEVHAGWRESVRLIVFDEDRLDLLTIRLPH
jgi:hypothetical protein